MTTLEKLSQHIEQSNIESYVLYLIHKRFSPAEYYRRFYEEVKEEFQCKDDYNEYLAKSGYPEEDK